MRQVCLVHCPRRRTSQRRGHGLRPATAARKVDYLRWRRRRSTLGPTAVPDVLLIATSRGRARRGHLLVVGIVDGPIGVVNDSGVLADTLSFVDTFAFVNSALTRVDDIPALYIGTGTRVYLRPHSRHRRKWHRCHLCGDREAFGLGARRLSTRH